MVFELEGQDLMSLLSEKYITLRQTYEKLWNDRSDIRISPSEWHLLARVDQRSHQAISSIAKDVSITRQATHKTLVSLREKGLIEIFEMPHNKRDKFVKLTPLGKQCCERSDALKQEMEEEINSVLGQANIQQLKALLREPWRTLTEQEKS